MTSGTPGREEGYLYDRGRTRGGFYLVGKVTNPGEHRHPRKEYWTSSTSNGRRDGVSTLRCDGSHPPS